jgi:AmiR/NasT family two-component response regulator
VFCLFGDHWIQDVDALEIERDGTVVAVVEYESPTIVRRLLEADVQAVIGKPIRPFGVLSTLVVATSRYRFECRQTAKILKLEDTLRSRRVVNKAVGKLATERGMSDDAAYQFIRQCSLERHLSMTKVADLILSDEESGLFKPS